MADYKYTQLPLSNPEPIQVEVRRPKESWALFRVITIVQLVLSALLVYLIVFYGNFAQSDDVFAHKAVVVLHPDAANVTGTIVFTQSSPKHAVQISGHVFGMDPDSKRGFHIHQYGDLTNGCTSTGSHFNPYNAPHGAMEDSLKCRHTGDLGNIESNDAGVATVNFADVKGGISLNGERSIIGRALVVHVGTDDLGRGENEESLKTGNAGGRAACGVIGVVTKAD